MNKREAAFKVIKQLRNGEWEFEWNPIVDKATTAKRKGIELWCVGHGFYTDFDPAVNAFGYVWRHVVYWFGIRPARKRFEQEFKEAHTPAQEWWEEVLPD